MKHKILLVDDQQELRMLLADSFRSRGYEVMEASDGASLKASFGGLQPDVALLDLKRQRAGLLDVFAILVQGRRALRLPASSAGANARSNGNSSLRRIRSSSTPSSA